MVPNCNASLKGLIEVIFDMGMCLVSGFKSTVDSLQWFVAKYLDNPVEQCVP